MTTETAVPNKTMMKKIVVFGASGSTGKLVVGQALEAGYQVAVVVRTPDAFKLRDRNLEIIKGDVLRPTTFENAVKGKDAVISCLGSNGKEPTTVYSFREDSRPSISLCHQLTHTPV